MKVSEIIRLKKYSKCLTADLGSLVLGKEGRRRGPRSQDPCVDSVQRTLRSEPFGRRARSRRGRSSVGGGCGGEDETEPDEHELGRSPKSTMRLH